MHSRLDFDYPFPEDLIATEPRRPSRVMLVKNSPVEITIPQLIEMFQPGDVLVINETRVMPRRVHAGSTEILFLSESSKNEWLVLFPSRDLKVGQSLEIPGGATMTLVSKGRPQCVRTSIPLDKDYFAKYGELPLPPYIQKARAIRKNQLQDKHWYQSQWSKIDGSLAAPTASLHFSQEDLVEIERRGATVRKLVLHVGLGTFLPISTESLDQHVMHSEEVFIPESTWTAVKKCRQNGGRVWSLGTTVARSLESAARGLLLQKEDGFHGTTNLFLRPREAWQIVDCLLTNFHQPQSTLLALVASFCDLETVKESYAWAIEQRFNLFSYGDLTAWIRPRAADNSK